MSPLYLPSPLGHHYYEAAQAGAFAMYVALLLGQGYRRGYAQRAWLPLVAAATLALVLGCQLALLPLGQWLGWLRGDAAAVQMLAGGPRSVIGGAIASWLAVLLLKRTLGFRGWGVFDAFGAPLCWALAVQSVGCVLAGCCWGEATAGGWGVAYGPGTAAYIAQLAGNLLPTGAAHTLPLVPTQLLQLLLCAGAGLVLHRARHRAIGWPEGSRYLLGMGLLCLGRFLVEFWRDPAGEPLLATPVALGWVTLPGVQWLLLAEALVLLGSWAWLTRRGRPVGLPETPGAASAAAPALVALALLAATARLASTTLSLPEIAVLQLLLLLVLLAEGRTWLTTLGRGVPRLAGLPLALLLGGALLLATAQAPAPQKETPPDATGHRHALLLSGGALSSSFDEYSQSSCNSNSYAIYHHNRAAGGELAYQWTKPTDTQGPAREPATATIGGGLWVGHDGTGVSQLSGGSFQVAPPAYTISQPLYDVHLYYEKQGLADNGRNTFAFRTGLHLGKLGYSSDAIPNPTPLLPELMARYGRRQTLFGQFDLGYGAENALGSYATRLALGSGLGQRNGSTLLVGYASAYHYPGHNLAFVSANLRLPGHSAVSGLSVEPYFATNFDRHTLFSLKLNYLLGLK